MGIIEGRVAQSESRPSDLAIPAAGDAISNCAGLTTKGHRDGSVLRDWA